MAGRLLLREGDAFLRASLQRWCAEAPILPRLSHVNVLRRLSPPSSNLTSLRSLHTTVTRAVRYRRFGEGRDDGPLGKDEVFGALPPAAQRRAVDTFSSGLGGSGQRTAWQRRGDDRWSRTVIVGMVVAAFGTYYVVHLERVPETGRLRFMDVTVAQEREIGDEEFKRTLNQYRGRILPVHDPQSQLVRRVAQRVLAAASTEHDAGNITAGHLPAGIQHGVRHGQIRHDGSHARGQDVETDWEVFVVKEDVANAFVLPNGKIFVFTGILPICQDEDGLATVLGHEIAHQIARHSAEKLAGTKLILWISMLLNATLNFDLGISRLTLNLLMDLPNSRAVEVEADRIGLRLMSAACFNPSKAPGFWRRMQQQSSKSGENMLTEVLSTHPLSSRRMKNMEDWMPEAQQIRQNTGCPSETAFANFRSMSAYRPLNASPFQ